MALTVAVVGAGTVSGVHLSGLQACPSTELVAVCDIDESAARDRASEFGIRPYFDLETMLESEELDWLHICTSVQSHLALARTAFEAGVPVLIEKPVTVTVAEYEELLAAAEEAGVHFSVVHNHLYDPAIRDARQRVERGAIGSVRSVDLLYSGLTPPDDVHRGSWVFDLPGGEFEEGLPHPLYLALDAAGYPSSAEDVTATTSLSREYEQGFSYDAAQVQYVSETGVLCSIVMLSGDIPQRVLRIHGTEGTLVVDLISQTVTALDRDYTGSKVGAVRNTTDRVVDRAVDTAGNLVAVARNAYEGDWASEREINPQYYLYEEEARNIERGDRPEAMTRARWTTTLLETIRAASTKGTDDVRSGRAEPVGDATAETD